MLEILNRLFATSQVGVSVMRIEGIQVHEIFESEKYTPLDVEGNALTAGRYTRVNVEFWVKAE